MGETKQRRPLRMTARIHETNRRHAVIGVWQNGGKAGELTVDVEMADRVVQRINAIDDETAHDTQEGKEEHGWLRHQTYPP